MPGNLAWFNDSASLQPSARAPKARSGIASRPTERLVVSKSPMPGSRHRVQTPHVRRGVDPAEAGVVEKVPSPPAFKPHHVQVEPKPQLGIEHRRQFAGRHPVTDRETMEADKRFRPGSSTGPATARPVNRIGRSRTTNRICLAGGSLHGIAHRGNVRCKTVSRYPGCRTRRCRLPRSISKRRVAGLSVKAIDDNAGGRVAVSLMFSRWSHAGLQGPRVRG